MQPVMVPGTLDYLDAIVRYVQEAAATARLNQQTTNRLRLAVEEIATNIFVHWYTEAGDKRVVELGADIDEQNLRFYLEDSAEAFNPFSKLFEEMATLTLPLEQRQPGQLGVYLAIRNVDRFIYERIENRNRNAFIMHRERQTAQQSSARPMKFIIRVTQVSVFPINFRFESLGRLPLP